MNGNWLSHFPNIEARRHFTEKRLSEVQVGLKKIQGIDNVAIMVVGSFGRAEASSESDVDYFVLSECGGNYESLRKRVDDVFAGVTGKTASPGGAFRGVHQFDDLLSSIGGQDDTNADITRRVLFLLEGRALSNEDWVSNLRRRLLQKYIKEDIHNNQLAMFFLNDIIRYYRTICVDFEYKTRESTDSKDWGTRNIKLVYSRRLLYFSGVIAAAEVAQLDRDKKIEAIEALLQRSPIERVLDVCGADAVKALWYYDHFLDCMSDSAVREELKTVEPGPANQNSTFRDLKNKSHWFAWDLQNALEKTYHKSHPIYRALIM